MNENPARVVSSEDEALILVDEADNEIGHLSKAECHDAGGVLHRAFSVFLFNSNGQLLLQKRAAGKRLWPLFWSNSCCSHPRRGESLELAATRRLEDELHARGNLEHVYHFIYQASFDDLGSEHELCHVFLGRIEGDPRANTTEIAEVRYVSAEQLDRELESEPQAFTPWFKLEWRRLREDYPSVLSRYLTSA